MRLHPYGDGGEVWTLPTCYTDTISLMSHDVSPHCVIAELTCRDNKDFIDSVTALFSGQCTSLRFTWMWPVKKKQNPGVKMTLQDVTGCHSLTLVFLQENDLGIGAEVLPGQDHLLASQNRAAVHVLLLHHGKLVCRSLGCRDTKRETGESLHSQSHARKMLLLVHKSLRRSASKDVLDQPAVEHPPNWFLDKPWLWLLKIVSLASLACNLARFKL